MANDDLPDFLREHRWEVGARLRSYRSQRGMTQEQLAAEAGVDSKTVSRAENGHYNISIDLIARLARALDIPSARLFPGG